MLLRNEEQGLDLNAVPYRSGESLCKAFFRRERVLIHIFKLFTIILRPKVIFFSVGDQDSVLML